MVMQNQNCRRCVDCIHFDSKKYLERNQEPSGRKRHGYLYGCKKRMSGYITCWVNNINDLSIYDSMLGCFESSIEKFEQISIEL